MDRDYIVKINEYLHIDDYNLDLILQCFDEIQHSEFLKEQLEIARNQIFVENQFDLSEDVKANVANHLQGANFFPLIVLLDKFDDVLTYYEKHKLPKEILLHTFSDVNLWIRGYKDRNQKDGFEELRWLQNHFKNKIFRLGRLQFIYKKNYLKARVYRNKKTNEIVIIPHDQVKFDVGGFTIPITIPSIDLNKNYFSSKVLETDTAIISNCILDNGVMIKKDVTLAKADYDLVLDENDDVLDVHIPAYESLNIEKCKQSFEQALEFYKTYFNDYNFKAFICDSWLLTPQFKEILGADSNILKFSSMFTHVSSVVRNSSFLFFVFSTSNPDLEKLPRKSSLQEAVYNHLKNNKDLCVTNGFILINKQEQCP
ncbi:acyltransferase domain-containing protein [Paenibacillus alginolyticus]|nr:acyltransferase domain-containing protein [Paenibacillus alginolyticus]MEC0148165.1 acyltransferase domain-containing protein [Paenibacillus alginolyticus]